MPRALLDDEVRRDERLPRVAVMTVFAGPLIEDTPGIGALTLGSFLLEVTARFTDSEALVLDDALKGGATVRWSYADLEREARSVARGLIATGVGFGTERLHQPRFERNRFVRGAPRAGEQHFKAGKAQFRQRCSGVLVRRQQCRDDQLAVQGLPACRSPLTATRS